MQIDSEKIERTLRNAQERLLAERAAHGGWEGELSSSALATATAIFALRTVDQNGAGRHQEAIQRGLAWLVDVQNQDGGWGDTPASLSNISTTALAWGAFVYVDRDCKGSPSRERAEPWLRQAAGSLAPERLSEAIVNRYGKDRTFSVPILSMLALAGCLGNERRSWRLVPQLPFELAACPHNWFKWLRLPVVSYALPALIGLGYLRHRRMSSRNPATSAVRNLVARRVLRKLEMIQPTSGGFLEATPLTSFVVMSLASSGEASNRIVDRGVEFLLRSQRGDGSWPVDTNLATWVTTLAVNALRSGGDALEGLGEPECNRILTWLLHQQYQSEHPYTHAAPGGWAWTDLPGGVPDADDTAGALLALHVLADAQETTQTAAKGVAWLVDLQNRDGGIPTFCPGWGRLPFDRSSPDITAHAVRALSVWRMKLNSDLQRRCDKAIFRMLRYLVAAQRSDGAWSPLWFGNQHSPAKENLIYGTSRVLRAAEAVPAQVDEPQWRAAVERGCRWILEAQNQDGGWGGDLNTPSSVEETSLSLEALSSMVSCERAGGRSPRSTNQKNVAGIGEEIWERALHRGAAWLCEATDQGRSFKSSPIGLYFAKLWYDEKLYPLIFSVAALRRLKIALHENQDNTPASGVPLVVSVANTGNALP